MQCIHSENHQFYTLVPCHNSLLHSPTLKVTTELHSGTICTPVISTSCTSWNPFQLSETEVVKTNLGEVDAKPQRGWGRVHGTQKKIFCSRSPGGGEVCRIFTTDLIKTVKLVNKHAENPENERVLLHPWPKKTGEPFKGQRDKIIANVFCSFHPTVKDQRDKIIVNGHCYSSHKWFFIR